MASNKTPNLGLDIWAEMDYFKRAEVNNNFTKIDAKAKENSDKIGALSTGLTTELAKKASLTKFDVVKKLNAVQRKDYKPFREYVYPPGFLGAFKPVKIFTDGKYYYTNFNKENFKNIGSTTRYVSKDGIWTNAGTTDSPLPLYKAINDSVSGDTIILKKGIYYADNTGLANLPLTINKSINLIGEDGVVLVFGKAPAWTLDSTTNLYKMSANNTYRVVDLNSLNYGFEFKKVATLSECQSTSFSWYTDGSTVYINGYYLGSNVVALSEYDTIRINPTSQINVYMENFSIVGGQRNLRINKNPSFPLTVTLNKIKGFYSVYSGSNFRTAGGNVLLVDCEAHYAKQDGFSYITLNDSSQTVDCNFVEINCIGANNGIGDTTGDNNNGSTAHSGIKGIRINGSYYNNYGANVGDVQPGTQTINLGCMAYESCAPDKNQGFGLQQAGAEVWIENCVGFGNSSDVVAYGGTTVHITKSAFESIAGGGTIEIS